MTFSTRSNPRVAQSGVALTSLGAVGGARGTAAGALRIFVEFLTAYDDKAVAELQGDLAKMESNQLRYHNNDLARQRKLQTVRQQLHQVDATLRSRVDAATRKQVKLVEGLEGIRTKAGKAQLVRERENLATLLRAQGLSKSEIDHITNRTALRRREQVLVRQTEAAEQRGIARTKQRAQLEGDIGKIQQIRANLAPRLAGLAVGAVGGILGGAILGVGFQIAESAIAAVGDKLQDLIDPARHAREAMKDLAASVNDIANQRNIRQLDAAKELIQSFGVDPATPRGEEIAALLARVSVQQQLLDGLKQEAAIREILRHQTTLDSDVQKAVRAEIVAAAKDQGTYRAELDKNVSASQRLAFSYTQATIGVTEYVGEQEVNALVTQEVANRTRYLTDQNYRLAESTKRAAQNASDASALWNVYAQSLSNAINQAVQLQTAGIDAQIAGLGDGASKKTKALERAIERAGAGGGGNAQELANIAEEKALLLLKMRLKLLGTNINLEKYSGKFLLVAINAKIAALQKEAEAQSRVNALLDLRYRMSKDIERQQGEGIGDFVERRAQEQRDLLAEQDNLQRDAQIAALEARKENLEDQLALEELAERRREALRQTGASNHLRNLQKQLEASKKADAKALAAKKKALEQQKAALEKAAQEAIALTSESAQAETYAAIRGMQKLEDVSKFSGKMAGLIRAKNAIQALVDGFGLPKWVAEPFLAKLNGMIQAASGRMEALYRNVLPKQGSSAFAEGGVFMMNNANHPFGTNVRAGEEGSELGIILSHNVAKLLQNSKPQVGQVGPFIIQQSEDPYRDKYAFGKLVRSSLEAALE